MAEKPAFMINVFCSFLEYLWTKTGISPQNRHDGLLPQSFKSMKISAFWDFVTCDLVEG
jgi:hypothetical protein